MLSHDEFRQQKGDFEMKKEQNRHSLHLIRQNVPQFILLVIFSVLLGVSVIAVSVLMKMFLDIATNASTMPLTTCLIIAVGVLLVLGISQVVTSVLQGKLSCRMELSLRSAMVEHLYRTDLRTFDSGAADNYFTRMTKDAETLSNFYSKTLIPSIFFESFTFVISFILMFLLEWKLAVVMIVVVPILIFTMIRISPKLEMNSIQIMQNEDKNRNILQEFLSQYMLFKSYGVLGWVQKRVGDTYAQKQKYVGKRARRNHRRHAHRRREPRQLLLRPVPAHFGLDGRGQRSEGFHKPHRRDPLHAHRK